MQTGVIFRACDLTNSYSCCSVTNATPLQELGIFVPRCLKIPFHILLHHLNVSLYSFNRLQHHQEVVVPPRPPTPTLCLPPAPPAQQPSKQVTSVAPQSSHSDSLSFVASVLRPSVSFSPRCIIVSSCLCCQGCLGDARRRIAAVIINKRTINIKTEQHHAVIHLAPPPQLQQEQELNSALQMIYIACCIRQSLILKMAPSFVRSVLSNFVGKRPHILREAPGQ